MENNTPKNNGEVVNGEKSTAMDTSAVEIVNPFQKSGAVGRSPIKTAAGASPQIQILETTKPETRKGQKETSDSGSKTSPRLSSKEGTPKGSTGISRLAHATKLANELHEFVQGRNNVHHEIKKLVVRIQKALIATEKEQRTLLERTEKPEEGSENSKKPDAKGVETVKQDDGMNTPTVRHKRGRQTPETSPRDAAKKKKQKSARDPKKDEGEKEKYEWKKVEKKSKKPPEKKQKAKPKTVRPKPDALVVGITGETTYAEVLRRVKNDPALKDLGDTVTRIRRTQNGEMLFELKKDMSAKSTEYKELVEKSLGEAAKVRALAHEVLVECRNLDEVTTEGELREALKAQFEIGDTAQTAPIRMRKAYGDTQIAVIKLPIDAANKLLKTGKVKVGWTVCSLRVTKQLERCFKCMGFGHQARHCKGTDRSKMCRRCGEEGHIGRICTNPIKCMLCPAGKKSDHITGGSSCPAFKKAMAAKKRWR